jgi:hypothetical protein
MSTIKNISGDYTIIANNGVGTTTLTGNVVVSGNLQITSTTGTPSNTTTPAAWLKVKVGASYYYQPLYQ